MINEKQKSILEVAMKLFSKKGYHATSIQEIAEKSGIAKGSVYNYFSSKEDLLFSILKYYHDILFEKIVHLDKDPSLPPREMFVKQIQIQLEEFVKYKDYFHMHMREQAGEMKEGMREYFFKMRAQLHNWYEVRLRQMYGPEIEPHIYDCIAILSGMIREYMFYIISENIAIKVDELAQFLVHRIDGIVKSFDVSPTTILNKTLMNEYMKSSCAGQSTKARLLSLCNDMKKTCDDLIPNEPYFEKASSSIDALIEELEQDHSEPRIIIIEGLLLMIEQFNIDALHPCITEFRTILPSLTNTH